MKVATGVFRGRARRAAAAVLAGSLILAACGGDEEDAAGDNGDNGDNGDAEEVEPIEMLIDPSGTAIFVAQEEGLYDGCAVDLTEVGYGEVGSLFVSGDSPVTLIAPHEVATEISLGEDMIFFSTAGALNFINGVAVRVEDEDTYQELPDLEGQTIGIPGFGSGTWAAFEGLVESAYGMNAREDFDIVEASPGALLGLLEQGEIDAALLFSGGTAGAMASDDFVRLTSFSEAWSAETGEILTSTGIAARSDWFNDNPDQAACLVEGIDAGVQWMMDNPQEFAEDGKYAARADGESWLASPEVNEVILGELEAGNWYLTHDVYTQEWIDSTYQFGESTFTGEGDMPSVDEVFAPADWLS